jgi:hypothetical protein
MKRFTLFTFLVILLYACAPSEETIKLHVVGTLSTIPTQTAYPTFTTYPTFTAYPTLTSWPTYTPQEPVIVIVTPTISPLLQDTLTETELPIATLDELLSPHGPGIYLVGVDIGPGIWRSDPSLTTDNCYWKITDKTGEIINNHFGMAGGTMYISPNAFEVTMEEACGTWTFLGSK